LHPAASHGVRSVSNLPFLSERLTEANPHCLCVPARAEALTQTFQQCSLRFQPTVRRRPPAPAESRRNESKIIPSSASTLRSFPLPLSRAIVTTGSPCCHAFPGTTEWPAPHVVAWCVLPPRSIEIVADSDFPWHPGHRAQPQGLEPSQSPLHRHVVADMPMPVAPLGFSDTGSPVPWHCAFTSENRTETRPDAPTKPARKPYSFPRPPDTPTVATA